MAFGEALTILLIVSGLYASLNITGLINQILCTLLCISGGLFGAEFPDIDSPSSIPRRHHPIIGILFTTFGVQHRGKFSHSILSQTIFWLFFAIAATLTINSVTGTYRALVAKIIIIIGLWQIISTMLIFGEVLFKSDVLKKMQLFKFLMFYMTEDKDIASEIHYRKLSKQAELIHSATALIFAGIIAMAIPNDLTQISQMTLIYFLGVYFGVLSHLFCDISTYQGIWLGWRKQIKPIQTLIRIPLLNLMIPDGGKTGGRWENRFRIMTSTIVIILFFILITLLANGK